ncbi:MAG: PAS domain S-box protein [Bacteroidia bacterium]
MFILIIGIIYIYYVIYNNQVKYRTYKSYFVSMFFESPEPLITFDKKSMKILDVNKAALKLLKYDYEELKNMKLLDLFKKNERANMLNEIASISGDEIVLTQIEILDKKLETLFVNLSFKSIENYDYEEYIILGIRDITDIIELKYEIELFKIKTRQFDLTLNNLFLSKLALINANLQKILMSDKIKDIEVLNELKNLIKDYEEFNKQFFDIHNSFVEKLNLKD